jgi:hypothetical protein
VLLRVLRALLSLLATCKQLRHPTHSYACGSMTCRMELSSYVGHMIPCMSCADMNCLAGPFVCNSIVLQGLAAHAPLLCTAPACPGPLVRTAACTHLQCHAPWLQGPADKAGGCRASSQCPSHHDCKRRQVACVACSPAAQCPHVALLLSCAGLSAVAVPWRPSPFASLPAGHAGPLLAPRAHICCRILSEPCLPSCYSAGAISMPTI